MSDAEEFRARINHFNSYSERDDAETRRTPRASGGRCGTRRAIEEHQERKRLEKELSFDY